MSMIKRTIDQERSARIEEGSRHPLLVVDQPNHTGRVIPLVDLDTVMVMRHVLDVWIQREEAKNEDQG